MWIGSQSQLRVGPDTVVNLERDVKDGVYGDMTEPELEEEDLITDVRDMPEKYRCAACVVLAHKIFQALDKEFRENGGVKDDEYDPRKPFEDDPDSDRLRPKLRDPAEACFHPRFPRQPALWPLTAQHNPTQPNTNPTQLLSFHVCFFFVWVLGVSFRCRFSAEFVRTRRSSFAMASNTCVAPTCSRARDWRPLM